MATEEGAAGSRQPRGAQRREGRAAAPLSMVLTGRQPQVPSLLSGCLPTASQEFLAWWGGGEGGCEDKETTGQRLLEQPSHRKPRGRENCLFASLQLPRIFLSLGMKGKCAVLGHSHAPRSRRECSPAPQLHAGPEGPAAHAESLFEAQADSGRGLSLRPGRADHAVLCPLHIPLWLPVTLYGGNVPGRGWMLVISVPQA